MDIKDVFPHHPKLNHTRRLSISLKVCVKMLQTTVISLSSQSSNHRRSFLWVKTKIYTACSPLNWCAAFARTSNLQCRIVMKDYLRIHPSQAGPEPKNDNITEVCWNRKNFMMQPTFFAFFFCVQPPNFSPVASSITLISKYFFVYHPRILLFILAKHSNSELLK